MTESQVTASVETVYPPKCEGVCHLGPKALELVGGVLGRNCSGPQLWSDETMSFQESTDRDLAITPTIPEDRDKLACANPRLVKAIRAKMDREIEDLVIETVEMER